ncbi:receptor expression-enhancing protein 5-like [Amblyomma americanum]
MAEMQQELSAVLRERSLLSGVLDKVEAVTRIKREVLVYVVAVLVVFLYVLNLAGPAVTHFITTAWPVLGSLRAMDRQSVELQEKWLGYWILYAIANSFEWLFVRLQRRIKRIYLLKLLVLVVCALPHPQCPARLIYARYLRHRVWYETGAVSSISAMASSAVEHISSAVSKATNGGQESPARKKPAAHKEAPPPPPKKSAAVGKKGK